MIALAFTLSYLESLLPLNIGVPGVKLGLANLVVVVALYKLKPGEAFAIAMIRILLAGLTFGNTYSLVYSLCGGVWILCQPGPSPEYAGLRLCVCRHRRSPVWRKMVLEHGFFPQGAGNRKDHGAEDQ